MGELSCFWFGHALPATSRDVIPYLTQDTFQCRRCGKPIPWATMPRQVIAMRAEYLSRKAYADKLTASNLTEEPRG